MLKEGVNAEDLSMCSANNSNNSNCCEQLSPHSSLDGQRSVSQISSL
jgi:hypothetical protein